VKRLAEGALASLHSQERSRVAFPLMQVGLPLLHLESLHKTLCRLPNIGGLHPVSLDRPYASYQTPRSSMHALPLTVAVTP
jgi:hypothetical protein